MASITGPGFGRLLPMPLLIPYGWEISNTVGLVFVAAGMIRDKRHRGAIHPAWFVGVAAIIGALALVLTAMGLVLLPRRTSGR